MNSWWFRMKPRSVAKTIEWFPYFAKLEGENWNYSLTDRVSSWKSKSIYPVRRKYIYLAHSEDLEVSNFEDYVSGLYDKNETESNGRNDKTSFEFFGFGYVDSEGIIKVTEIGRIINEGKMTDELLLRQLLKIQFPSPAIHEKADGEYVFPMQVLLEIFKRFDYLNKFELALLFGCNKIENVDNTVNAINEFREEYNKLDNKLKIKEVKELFNIIFKKYYPQIKNKPETYYSDYGDAFIRCLQYTGIFAQRGRGLYVKLYVPEHSQIKLKLLQDKYEFKYNEEQDLDKYMEWFGNPYNITLPWESVDSRKIILSHKIKALKENLNEAKAKIEGFEDISLEDKVINIEDLKTNKELIELENDITNKLITLNEELFIKYNSKTKEVRDEIIDKFLDILEGNEDMGALWLECNTWKSLIAINGTHTVKRNFKIEDDLTPKAFAPGTGNTPDMELYKNGYIIIPEVSLMTGVRQWEHEGSSVIDHVLKFIETYNDKEVYGLFISSKMNIRTIWQFFILNRESWIGKAVPVIPLTIQQYINVITYIYEMNLTIDTFKELIETVHKETFKHNTFKEWEEKIDLFIDEWKKINMNNIIIC